MTNILIIVAAIILLVHVPSLLVASYNTEEEYEAAFYSSVVDSSEGNTENNNDSRGLANSRMTPSQMQDHRELLFWNRCDNDRRTPFCICTEEELREEISNAGDDRDNPTDIRICLGRDLVIRTGPVDVTGKAFRLSCGPIRVPGRCGVSGRFKASSGPAFIGAPVYANFVGIYLEYFNNTSLEGLEGTGYKNEGLGGILYMTGGYTRLFESQLIYSVALKGGAVYATGSTTVVELFRTLVSENVAEFGGGMYAANNATLMFRSVGFGGNVAFESGGALYFDTNSIGKVRSTSFLNNSAPVSGYDMYIAPPVSFVNCTIGRDNEPSRFCDGSMDGFVVEGADIEAFDTYTNCHEVSSFDSEARRCERFRNSPEYR